MALPWCLFQQKTGGNPMTENLATDYTPTERVLLLVSNIVAQSQLVLTSVAEGREHQLGVYQNEYGRVIQPGKQQRKRLVGMIVVGEILQQLTDAFVAARETTDGQALLAKIEAKHKEAADADH